MTKKLDTFLFMVMDSLEKLEVSDKFKRQSATNHNMTWHELQALKTLKGTIVIKSAYKGGNLVVMDHLQYHKMWQAILSDKILESDPTEAFRTELATILQHGIYNHLIDRKEFEFLLPAFLRVVTFYGLNKVHKSLTPLKCRPIVLGVDINQILCPFVVSLPSS